MQVKRNVKRVYHPDVNPNNLLYPKEKFELVSIDFMDTWDVPHTYTRSKGQEIVTYSVECSSITITLKCKKCGHIKQVVDRKSIGCKQGPCHQNWKDLTGMTFGDLTAIEYKKYVRGKNKKERWYWLCECRCGRKYLKTSHDLLIAQHSECGICARKRVTTKNTLPNQLGKWHREYRVCKKNALSRNYAFELSFDDFYKICNSCCYYCGADPELRSTGLIRNGVDRFDNNEGYTVNNSVPCCSRCNTIKLDIPFNDLLVHLERILKHCKQRSTTISKESTSKRVEMDSTKTS